MNVFFRRTEVIWAAIAGMTLWMIVITFTLSHPRIVTVNVGQVIRSGVQEIAFKEEVSEQDKAHLADRVQLVFERYSNKHKVYILNTSSVVSGPINDITDDIIKELNP